MKRLFFILSCIAFISSCGKAGISPVSGTINGEPALTLYGNSNRPADYILLSKDPAKKEIVYDGVDYTYFPVATSSQIFITLSSAAAVKGTLTTTSSKTTLTIDSSTVVFFGSSIYTSN